MAKKVWDEPIDKTIPWDGNENTNNLPVCGYRVEEFIKSQLDSRIGVLYYDITNNRYLAFSDTIDRDEYLDDPTKVDLILATFDAPFNYSAEITLQTPSYNAVFLNSTGNYIDFTFDIVNKQGASTGENVIISYTFIRNANKQVVTETRKFGDVVHFNIDKYLGEGTNTIIIGITGQTTLAATTTAITYQVVNLTLSDDLNIARYYNISEGPQQVEIPFTVSGYGTKIVEWYIDGELLDFIKSEDEVVDVITTRTKYITISNLNQGSHSLQIRAYTVINGERFYTDTLYRDLLVYTGNGNDVIIGISTTIPRDYGILGSGDKVAIYEMTQYVPYTLRFATYSPLNAAATEVVVMLDEETIGTTISKNGIENEFIITSKISGNRNLKLISDKVTKELVASIKETSMNIEEIEGAIIDFNALGKNNESSDRDTWTNGIYTGILRGFNWNNTSGWVNGRLEMNAGSSFTINYAPLSDSPTNTGKTIEIEWSTKNVTNDDVIICDLRNNNGVGIVIRATKVSMISADGVIVETEYKSDENVRIGFVINKSEGTTNRRLSFIYTNGIVSRAEQWSSTDNYNSDKEIAFYATNEAEVSLKSIKIYNTALSSDNMLNNFILYRDTISEMMEVYDRNDVYEAGTTTFSPNKMMNRLPVMIVTGNIPILENTSDKDEQIIVDIEYYNIQDPSRSFTMKNAAMRPQGTSSMGYPKKNFRIYTQKVANTELYDSTGTLVENKLYSFKDKAQPVDCWCLKADYAESSGTHNTGIARLWNDALYNAQIDGEYKLRTNAQKVALNNKYNYDVRTTIDGFPILLFYRLQANDDLIFIGKYNFNNDKSTEKVFGFTDIPGFNNSKMQCWEVLNNGNPLALFTSTDGFDDNWAEAFESRYPDTKTPNTSDLKSFCEWMTNVSPEDFATQKWEHLDIYKMAAYWIYLMRHAAADQFVKNAMFTSEDGVKWYYILYDNDTINGLINSGYLRIKPTDGRQTIDDTGSYVFAGHDSRLWNLLEADEEFMNILSSVDNALYTAGISYDNTIRIFDEEQADKWVEKVYNQDAQYKYIGPYVEKGINNLFMLQGKRDLHRKWWLAKRFSIFDAKYVSGSYKSQAVEIKCLNGTEVGQKFTIKAGYPLDYGYGINNIPRSFGITLDIGETHEFTTQEIINIGDPLRIYGAPNISELDFSKMSDRLAVVTIANVYADNLGTKLTKLILGNPNKINYEISEISGLKQAIALEELDIQGMNKMVSIDLSNHQYFKRLKAFGSNLSSVTFAKGAPVERLELPSSMRVLSLEQLPLLDSSNIIMENIANVQYMSIRNCPNVSDDFSFVYNWYSTKTTTDAQSTLIADNVVWENVHRDQFHALAQLKVNGGTLDLKGKVSIPNATLTSIRQLKAIFGETAFYPDSDFYIEVPPVIEISASKNSVWENESLQLEYELYPVLEGNVVFSLVNGRKGCSINTSTGLITTTETALDTSTITARATFTSTDGKVVIRDDYDVEVKRRIYPTEVSINGTTDPYDNQTYTLNIATSGVNGDYNVSWDLQGGLADYFSIISSDNSKCVLEIDGTAPDSKGGMLIATIKRRFDGVTVSSAALTLNYIVGWPENVVIVGENNPIDDLEYTWQQSSLTVTGDYYATWMLDGNITSYLSIASSDTMDCVLKIDRMPMEQVGGRLILTVYKSYNDEVIASTFRGLSAYKEGVIITDWSNAPIQKALYDAGLVANAIYTLKSEAEVITAAQLQPGTAQTTSVFYAQRTKIKSFDEFQYFTGVIKVLQRTFQGCNTMTSVMLPNSVTELENYAFQGCSALTDITFSTSLLKLGSSTFAACSSLATVTLPTGFTTIGSNTFIDCPNLESLFIPASTNTIGGNVFMNCGKLNIIVDANNQTFKSVEGVLFNKVGSKLIEYAKDAIQPEYVVPDGVTYVGHYAFYNRKNMTYIEFPSTLTRLGNDVISMCSNLRTLRFNGRTAPTLDNASVFGATEAAYTGRNTYSTGENKLYLSQLNATGFEEGLFLDPLQNASKCGFSIHGKLIINSNRSNATFSVSYTTEGGSTKSVSVGVGTSYISDIKYNTSVTIKPNALSGYTWDSNSISFTYSATTNSATLNAYVYPTNATISGETNPVDNPTYTWTTTTANVDGEYTATWTLSGNITSYASIASQNNTSCTLSITEAPTEEITGTLTLAIKPKVGNAITTTKTLKALLPGVVITSKSNPGVQASLYAAGLVANEKYSLQSEVENITGSQLVKGSGNFDGIFFDQKGNITNFDEFKYFTNVTDIPSMAFAYMSSLSTLSLPSSVTSIHFNAFYESYNVDFTVSADNKTFSAKDGVLYNKVGDTLILYRRSLKESRFTVPSGVTTLGDMAFRSARMTSITLPESITTLSNSCLAYNNSLTSVNIPSNVTSLPNSCLYNSRALAEITIPAGITSIGDSCFYNCHALKKITMLGQNAPTVKSGTFGSSSSSYTGKNTATSGENALRIPLNATGYKTSYWLDPLQNADKCNFHIHGEITITSNKSNAQFNITYISEGDVNKTVTVGVGTFYINDVKYDTSMTVTPNALSGYTWEKSSETITYNGATTVTLNAYIYPTSTTISGDSAIRGGNSATYTASVSPSNVDIGVIYSWSLSSSANASISSSSGNQCTITTQSVETEESLTLTCVATTTDGKKVQKTFAIALQAKPNFITATYNVTSTTSATALLGSTYSLSNIAYMEIDGVKVTPVLSYTFSTKGTHTIKIQAQTLESLFSNATTVVKVDLSECDGSLYSSVYYMFANCSGLTSIIFGECKINKITSLEGTFKGCAKLTSIDLSPFAGSNLTSIVDAFPDCTALKTVDFTPFNGSTLEYCGRAFNGCTNLEYIDLTPFTSCVFTMNSNTAQLFYRCAKLKTILVSWKTAPSMHPNAFGNYTTYYTGRDTYSTGENKLYVPSNATGYDSGYWKDPLQHASKCGFTISKTL